MRVQQRERCVSCTNSRCHPLPCACKLLRQMLPGFISLHLLRYPHPCAFLSPHPTSSPNFASCVASPFPISRVTSRVSPYRSLFPFLLFIHVVNLFNPSSSISLMFTVQCRKFFYFLIQCHMPFNPLCSMGHLIRAICKGNGKKRILQKVNSRATSLP